MNVPVTPWAVRVALLLAVGFGGGWAWLQVAGTRGGIGAAPATPEAMTIAQRPSTTVPEADILSPPRIDRDPHGPVIDTADNPAATAAAIRALGMALAADAVPVLRQVMDAGEPQDRALAVAALRELALREGDADGRIRQLLRIQFHDGGDEPTAQQAREALADLEDRLPAS